MFEFDLWTRDVKQAFIQSSFPLDRTLFIKPATNPDIMSMANHPKDSYLKALKPIYGLSESPGYWWQTFKNNHISEMGMKQSSLDPCLFYEYGSSEPLGIIGTLVDDTLGCRNTKFMEKKNLSQNHST